MTGSELDPRATRVGSATQVDKRSDSTFAEIQAFYDREYFVDEHDPAGGTSWHTRMMARRLGDVRGRNVLDVACGRGDWLALLEGAGAHVSGIDISEVAVASCRRRLPRARVVQGPAESLPFEDASFDVVTCLGSLEHFLDKEKALREMVRVGAAGARYLLLVPNRDFLTRRLGLFGGTQQARVVEDVLALDAWQRMIEGAGLAVDRRYRDLHVLSTRWITSGSPRTWPLRLAQAAVLPFWPMAWQYQVHHLCSKRQNPMHS